MAGFQLITYGRFWVFTEALLPATNMGQVAAAWGEIEARLARGMKLREVWEAAKMDGLEIPARYKFTVRVNRDILFEAPYEPVQADPEPKHGRTTTGKQKD